jgi:predicted small metal-binding protein
MAKIECPICDMDVTSQVAVGLGDSFKRHLMDVHRMSSLACIDMNEGVEPAKEIATYEERRHVTVERPVGGETASGTTMAEGLEGKVAGGKTEPERRPRDVLRPPGSARSSTMIVDEHMPTERVREVTESGVSRKEAGRPVETASGRVVGVSEPREELEDVRITAPEFVIKCPFCNRVLRADDDKELGRDLKGHWGDEHQIRPTIRAELHMSRAR